MTVWYLYIVATDPGLGKLVEVELHQVSINGVEKFDKPVLYPGLSGLLSEHFQGGRKGRLKGFCVRRANSLIKLDLLLR
jgi:hypothetical protein